MKNLCTFLCQDVEQTPTFAYSRTIYKGILTLQTWSKIAPGKAGKEMQEKGQPAKSEDEAAKTRLSRRGAGLAFDQLSAKFGSRLLEAIPKMWQSMAGGLLSACSAGTAKLTSVIAPVYHHALSRVSARSRCCHGKAIRPGCHRLLECS